MRHNQKHRSVLLVQASIKSILTTLLHPQQLELDWEDCEDGTMVLLPPPYVSAPKSVIHFVGGTFFGSSPKLWYRTLLEGIVQTTSSRRDCHTHSRDAPPKSIASCSYISKLQRQFQTAYINIVQDEYGMDELTQCTNRGHGTFVGSTIVDCPGDTVISQRQQIQIYHRINPIY